MSISMIPNIKTQEQADRVNELLDIKSNRSDEIVRFVYSNSDAIIEALRFAMMREVITDEKDFCSEDEEEVTILEAFRDRIKQWEISNQKLIHFTSTGTEDTMFPPQRKQL